MNISRKRERERIRTMSEAAEIQGVLQKTNKQTKTVWIK